ncbi:MAG: FAD-dependent oxidoreductase [Alphaproteobacteria bacterium]|nr:MAG: FAD-dependent oxidoreductase [Alphaproteobacteria bacterium]
MGIGWQKSLILDQIQAVNSKVKTADFIIIGGGIAGASAGFELCKHGRVIILEKEGQAGYHTTGRSSAIFQKSYNNGDPLLNILVRTSEDFLRRPPEGFTGQPLLKPRPLIYIATAENQDSLDSLHRKLSDIDVKTHFVSGEETRQLLPVLARKYQGRILREQGAADMDVTALHQGYLRAIKSAGGDIITRAGVTGLARTENHWQVTTAKNNYRTPVVINAAGAWVDQVAEMANISPIHIQPLRRTVIMVALPKGTCPDGWPLVMDTVEGYYFKPEQGKILMTPGDEKLMPPSDVQPEEIDIAYGAHFLETATRLKVDKIDHSWAGLRNQVADGHPVVGFDPEATGFFWLAGQGGFGIKTAPAMGRITASLIMGKGLPQDMLDLGLTEDQISVKRIK